MIKTFKGIQPKIAESAFIADNTSVIGDVKISENVSIWYGTVLRGDASDIFIGKDTNIQDLTMVHSDADAPTYIGERVTIGHNAVIHACRIGDDCLIGMGAIILDGAVIESECMVAAGSVVTPGKVMPSGHLILGSPAKAVRLLTDEEKLALRKSAAHYVELANAHKEE